MKIALVLERFDIDRGGAERSTSEMAAGLARLGHDVTIVAGRGDKNTAADEGSFAVEILGVGDRRWSSLAERATAYFAAHQYDIIHSMVPLPLCHVYQPRQGSMRTVIRRHALAYAVPLVRSFKQATAWMNSARRQRARAERVWCRQGSGTLAAVSSYVARQFRADYGLSEDRIAVVRNGVGVERLRTETARKNGAKLRACYNRDGRTRLLLYVSQNFRLKGLTHLLGAVARTKKSSSSDVHFKVLVFGSEFIGPYHKLADRLGITDRVLFMQSTSEMPAVLNAVDAAVLPTWNDACSRTIMEALAVDKPVITTRCNGAADFIEPDKHGWLIVDPMDVDGLAAALMQTCSEDVYRRRQSAVQNDELWRQVAMDRHVQELVELYEHVSA